MTTSKKNRLEEVTMPYVTEDNLTDVAMERWKGIPAQRLRQSISTDSE